MRTTVSVKLVGITVLLAGMAGPAALQGQTGAQGGGGSDVAIGLRLGTLGAGLELGKQLMDHVSARVGLNFGSLNSTGKKQSNITYDVHLKLKALEALVDLYPASRGVFHFTVGLLTNPMTITGDGQPSGSGFNINNTHYMSSDVGTLSASGKFPGALPYLGLGFGTPASRGGRVKFLFDLGVGIGKPTLALSATGAASNPTLLADLEAQRAKTQTDLNKVAVYPVISLGLAIHL